jgi:hypothetical protein
LTTHSVQGPLAASGLPRIDLTRTDTEELVERLGFEEELADALIAFGGGSGAKLETLLTEHIRRTLRPDEPVRRRSSRQQSPQQDTGPELATEQLRAVFAETRIGEFSGRPPGRINLNTVSEDLLRQLMFGREHLADEIVYLRSNGIEGITSIVDLIDIPAFQEDTGTLELLARISDTTSNVYSICSRGRSFPSGVEVEIIAVVDRSTLPIRILEYREQ